MVKNIYIQTLKGRAYMKRNKWMKLFFTGLIIYNLGLIIMLFTMNTNIYPSVIILGNFLIPVTYVTFFYERRTSTNVSMSNVAACFFYGGFLGTFAAAVIEPIFIRNINIYTAMVIGIIEEFVKVFGVLMILKKNRHKLEIDGIVLGAAAGMGFAAIESCGYAFTSFLATGGNFTALIYTINLRGILAPLAHGTWTAILTGVLFRERTPHNLRVNLSVVWAYILVIILHGLWDGLPPLISPFIAIQHSAFLCYVVIGIIGLLVLYKLYKEAKAQALEK